jgi:hypothetical protein
MLFASFAGKYLQCVFDSISVRMPLVFNITDVIFDFQNCRMILALVALNNLKCPLKSLNS